MPLRIDLEDLSDSYQVPLSGSPDGGWLVYGNGGNDTIIGWNGNDILVGGLGDDRLNGLTGNDILIGEEGNDWLWGDDGNDSLYGGSGGDELNGGKGEDYLFGQGGGVDNLYGGSGNDLYVHDFNLGGITVVNDLSGNQIGNMDALNLLNPLSINLRFSSNKSTLYIYENGEWNGSGIDNGVIITGALRNTGEQYVGTIEILGINGTSLPGWMDYVYSAWDMVA